VLKALSLCHEAQKHFVSFYRYDDWFYLYTTEVVQQSIKEIEHYVQWSMLREMAVSIKLRDYSEPLITCITNFLEETNPAIVEIAPSTLYGEPIQNTRIPIDQIEKVTPLAVKFSDPMYTRLREAKQKFLKSDGSKLNTSSDQNSGNVQGAG
jgi:hypothetical protein